MNMHRPVTPEDALPAGPLSPEQRRDPQLRKRLAGPALRAFFAITERWRLATAQQRALLGYPAESTFFLWKKGLNTTLSHDQLERISLVLGIHRGVRLIFADDAVGDAWMQAPNTDPVFGGKSPLQRMLDGSIDDLYAVRRYVDGWREAWN